MDLEPEFRPRPVIDLNGCLLAYLAQVERADPNAREGIGCTIPYLLEGNVKIQILSIYSGVEKDSPIVAWQQADRFLRLLEAGYPVRRVGRPSDDLNSAGIHVAAAIESATCLCDETEPLKEAFVRLERFQAALGKILYLTLTRQGESRFAGGSDTEIGLKRDGRELIEYVSGMRVGLDLSHASERTALEALDWIETRFPAVKVLVSHANFKEVWAHPGNVSDRLAREVIRRGGLIGLNLIRAFVHPDDPDSLYRHIEHGLRLGGERALCFGADFFYWPGHADRSRIPFYFPEHENAGRFPGILRGIEEKFGVAVSEAVAYGNALRFMEEVWDPESQGSTP